MPSGIKQLAPMETALVEAARSGLYFPDDEALLASVSPSLTVRAEVLRRLILGLPLVDGEDGWGPDAAVPHYLPRGVHLSDVSIEGELDLSDATGPQGSPLPALVFQDCEFPDRVLLDNARLSRLSFEGSKLNRVSARALRSQGLVNFSNVKPHPDGKGQDGACELDFGGAQLDAGFLAASAHLRVHERDVTFEPRNAAAGDTLYALNLKEATIRGDVHLQPGFVAEGGVSFSGAHIRGDIWMRGAEVTAAEGNAIRGDGLRVDGAVSLAANVDTQSGEVTKFRAVSRPDAGEEEPLSYTAAVWMWGARIADTFQMTGARVEGAVCLPGARIGGDVDLGKVYTDSGGTEETGFHASLVEFTRASVGGSASFIGARIDGMLRGCHARIEKSFQLGTSEQPSSVGSRGEGRGSLDLSSAEVGGDLQLIGNDGEPTTCAGRFDLRAVSVGGQIYLGNVAVGATFDARNLTVEEDAYLGDGKESLSCDGSILLKGATIGGRLHLHSLHTSALLAPSLTVEQETSLSRCAPRRSESSTGTLKIDLSSGEFGGDLTLADVSAARLEAEGASIRGNLKVQNTTISQFEAPLISVGQEAKLFGSQFGNDESTPHAPGINLSSGRIGGILKVIDTSVSHLVADDISVQDDVYVCSSFGFERCRNPKDYLRSRTYLPASGGSVQMKGVIDLREATVDGSFWIDGIVFRGPLHLHRSRIDGMVAVGSVDMRAAVHLNEIAVTGGLRLRAVRLYEGIWAQGASIGGDLQLEKVKLAPTDEYASISSDHDEPVLGEVADVSFRNVEIGGELRVRSVSKIYNPSSRLQEAMLRLGGGLEDEECPEPTIHRRRLRCYPGWWLVEVHSYVREKNRLHPATVSFLWRNRNRQSWKRDGAGLLLDTTSLSIHRFNDFRPPETRPSLWQRLRFRLRPSYRRLGGDHKTGAAKDYLAFFTGYLWGPQGPFRIVAPADLDQTNLPNEVTESATFRVRLSEDDPPLEDCRQAPQDGGSDGEDGSSDASPNEAELVEGIPAFEACAAVLYGGELFRALFSVFMNGTVDMKDDVRLEASGEDVSRALGLDEHYGAAPLRIGKQPVDPDDESERLLFGMTTAGWTEVPLDSSHGRRMIRSLSACVSSNPRIDLADAHADRLDDENGTAWGQDVTLILDGFTYSRAPRPSSVIPESIRRKQPAGKARSAWKSRNGSGAAAGAVRAPAETVADGHPDGGETAGDWKASGTVLYGGHLFNAEFAIRETGMVEMLEDEQIELPNGLIETGEQFEERPARLSEVREDRGGGLHGILSGPWSEIDPSENQGLATLLRSDGLLAGKTDSRIFVRELACYPGWTVVEVHQPKGRAATATGGVVWEVRAFLWNPEEEEHLELDGTSPPIHSFNAKHVDLPRLGSSEGAQDYLQFFCAYVWGQDGPFRIVEPGQLGNLDGISLEEDPAESLRVYRDRTDAVTFSPEATPDDRRPFVAPRQDWGWLSVPRRLSQSLQRLRLGMGRPPLRGGPDHRGLRPSRFADRQRWLDLQYRYGQWNAMDYRPHPYEVIANALRNEGDTKTAREIQSHRLTLERKLKKSWYLKPFWFAFGLLFNYGLSTSRATLTLLLFWAFGYLGTSYANQNGFLIIDFAHSSTFVLDSNVAAEGSLHADRVPAVGLVTTGVETDLIRCGNNIFEAFYALDAMVPVLDLHQEDTCEIRPPQPEERRFSMASWLTHPRAMIDHPNTWAFLKTLYSILGGVVVSIAILTFSGILRRHTDS